MRLRERSSAAPSPDDLWASPRSAEPPPPLTDEEYFLSEYGDVPAINYYSYRPRLQFKGKGPLFFGMELEVTTDQAKCVLTDPLNDRLVPSRIVARMGGDVCYMKTDGSVEGFEIVTHPMSYDFAMNEFPWAMLPKLKEYGCRVLPSTNGIHVHVSRDGFDGTAHSYRWMKLWYRNTEPITSLAGRRPGRWSSYSEGARKSQYYHLKNEAIRNAGGWPRGRDEEAEQQGYQRYNAINTTNRPTFEVRVFAATLNPEVAKARLQLVAATVEYTRQLKARDITKGHAWEWDQFSGWVKDRKDTYPELASRV